MFTEARLLTRDGDFVADVDIPLFTPPADVLIWGERFFVFRGQTSERLIYHEGFTWFVTDVRGRISTSGW